MWYPSHGCCHLRWRIVAKGNSRWKSVRIIFLWNHVHTTFITRKFLWNLGTFQTDAISIHIYTYQYTIRYVVAKCANKQHATEITRNEVGQKWKHSRALSSFFTKQWGKSSSSSPVTYPTLNVNEMLHRCHRFIPSHHGLRRA